MLNTGIIKIIFMMWCDISLPQNRQEVLMVCNSVNLLQFCISYYIGH